MIKQSLHIKNILTDNLTTQSIQLQTEPNEILFQKSAEDTLLSSPLYDWNASFNSFGRSSCQRQEACLCDD